MGFGVRLLQLTALSALGALVLGSRNLWLVAGGALFVSIARVVYLNATSVANPPPSSPVPKGKLRICVAGYTHSGPTAKAHYLADLIAKQYPDKYETWYYFDQYAFWDFAKKKFDPVPFPPHLKGHSTSPFVWFETAAVKGSDNVIEPIGGSDRLSSWALEQFPSNTAITALANENFLSLKPYFDGRSYHCNEGRPVPAATAQ